MNILQWLDYHVLLVLTGLGGTSVARDKIVYFTAEIVPFVAIGAGVWILMSGKTEAESQRNQDVVIASLGALLLAIGARLLIGSQFLRLRPYVQYPELHSVYLPNTTNVSFPSMHALLLFTFAAVVYFEGRWRKLGIALFVLATLVILARVVAAVHYPSDVIGGAAIGIGIGWLVAKQIAWMRRQLS
jgi:undecaprenyl-diphosphatase